MTRAEICIAALEGLSDDEVRALVAAGGMRHIHDSWDRVQGIMTVVDLARDLPRVIEASRSAVVELRPKLVAILAEIDTL